MGEFSKNGNGNLRLVFKKFGERQKVVWYGEFVGPSKYGSFVTVFILF